MPISLIAAVDKNGGIGINNKMPWHIPADLKYFKKVTTDKIVVMGRKTFESIGNKPLPDRFNIILSQTMEPGLNYITMDSVSKIVNNNFINFVDVMVIGGASVYAQLLPYADTLYLTEIDAEFNCDTVFPQWDREEFDLVHHQPVLDSKQSFSYAFKVYQRKVSAL